MCIAALSLLIAGIVLLFCYGLGRAAKIGDEMMDVCPFDYNGKHDLTDPIWSQDGFVSHCRNCHKIVYHGDDYV